MKFNLTQEQVDASLAELRAMNPEHMEPSLLAILEGFDEINRELKALGQAPDDVAEVEEHFLQMGTWLAGRIAEVWQRRKSVSSIRQFKGHLFTVTIDYREPVRTVVIDPVPMAVIESQMRSMK